MAMEVVNPSDFLTEGAFFEDNFIERSDQHDWNQYRDRPVLVRGCSTTIPPWAYMYITGKLVDIAKSVRYGNEHDNIVVYRAPKKGDVQQIS